MNKEFIRNCPECNVEMSYSFYQSRYLAEKNKCKCKKCNKEAKELNYINESKRMIELIMPLYNNGLENKEIASILKIRPDLVSRYLSDMDLKSNTRANNGIDMIDEFNAKCRKCNKILDIKNFCLNRRGKKDEYILGTCNSCRYSRNKNIENGDLYKFFNSLYVNKRKQCKKLGIEFNLSVEYLIELNNSQERKCYYLDTEMILKRGNISDRYTISIDRVVPEKGYTVDNVVLCSRKANTAKNNISELEIKEYFPLWYGKLLKDGFYV